MTPRAFVLMPFAAEFDEIYNLFIADALTSAGYSVQRADDLRNPRNILQDVITGIAMADLVVADLTGSNPNVYYELGIAHALKRKVVMLTQSIDDLPFDLRSYRTIPYNTHFSAVRSAREELIATAKGASDGSLAFSSPLLDYLPHDRTLDGPAVSVVAEDSEEGELGFLDYMVRIEEGFGDLTAALLDITERTDVINQETNKLSSELPLAVGMSPGSAKRARDLIRAYSGVMSDYARSLEKSVTAYNGRLNETRESLEYVVGAQAPVTDEEREQLRNFLDVLRTVEDQAFAGRSSYAALAETIAQLPKVEKKLDRARKETISQLRGLVESIDKTIEMISNAQSVGSRILRASELKHGSSE